MEITGTDIHHLNLFACCCVLLYFLHYAFSVIAAFTLQRNGLVCQIPYMSSHTLNIVKVIGCSCSIYTSARVMVCISVS